MTNLIFIIAHAPLASALRQCVAHVFADRMDTVLALDIAPQNTVAESLEAARGMLQAKANGPVLLLTDVLGATPCNVARQLVKDASAQMVAGVNLPMLWRAVAYQNEPLTELVCKALQGGIQGVVQVDATMTQASQS